MLAAGEASQLDALMPYVGFFAAAAAIFSIAGQWVSIRLGQPALEILARWSRLTTFSLGVTYLAFTLQWSLAENRPPWSLALIVFLACLLFETINTWLKVRSLSYEDTPLFPKYTSNEEQDEWPTDHAHIRLREWVRKQKFRQVASLRAHPFPGFCIREFYFDSKDGLTRLSVTFLPRGLDSLYVTHTATSLTSDGERYVTDNAYLPYGGCFPDTWALDRKPLTRSPARLLKRHIKRMEDSGKKFSPWADLPLDDVRHQHRLLEKENKDRGILNPRSSWEEYGRFSQEGRFRMWKEILLLNYFGLAVQ